MKKFLLALLAVVCFTCLGIAAAACTGAKYYTLYFNTVAGANVVCEIPSGYEVKEGYKVVFKVELDEDAEGDPKVAVNGKDIDADSNGYYSFKMKGDTTVSVTGVYAAGRSAILFDKGDKDKNDYRVTYKAEYVDENGRLNRINTESKEWTNVKSGTEVTFSIDVSVYYGENPEFHVLSNTAILTPQSDGKYHVTVGEKVTVSIQGLKLEKSFAEFPAEEGGDGTVENPFRLRKPIDLYVLASFMNNDLYYNQLSTAYYSLEADIDMKGEELFIIGISADPANPRYFSGDFNGNGHTISNYYISDTAFDQDDYTEGFMPNIGLFGVAADAKIYNLNLENFNYDINAAPWKEGFFAGGIVAYGVGVEITNCSVSGTVMATADSNSFGFIGGIIGYQSAAAENGTYYHSAVRSCSTNVNIVGRAGYIYGAGGIAGRVSSLDELTAAMIINCYSTGDVAGAMCAGGIAGIVSSYCSVTNCYATGYVDANNRLGNDPDYKDFRYAYSGGIAGELAFDAVVANSFFAGEVTAIAASGQSFASKGDIVGYAEKGGNEGGTYIHTETGLVYNCASVNDNGVNINKQFIINTLGWNEGDWKFGETGYPVVNGEAADNTVGITVKKVNNGTAGSTVFEQEVENAYLPLSYWYVASYGDSGALSEFITDGGLRSFGYYFDEQLTVRVPNSYVPAHDVTLYAGFTDYSEVAGRYYLQWTPNGSGKYLELTGDGILLYRDGGLSSESYYYYDGETVMLRDTYLAIIDGKSVSAYTSFKATVENGVMTIWDNQYYEATGPIKAVKHFDFGYGKYYGADVEYTFNTDGTGVYTSGGTGRPFTYTVSGNDITIKLSDNTILTGTLTGGVVTAVGGTGLTACDKFEGVWEKSAGSHKEYTFDGKGGWSYRYYGYNTDGTVVPLDSASGSYTYTGNGIDLGGGKIFTINQDGCLELNGEVYYYKVNSYAGKWSNFAKFGAVEITFGGVTSEGYGNAVINYGAGYGSYDLTYDVKSGTLSVKTGEDDNGNDIITSYENKNVIRLYRNDVLIASLAYFENTRTLWGGVYQISSGETEPMTLYLYDDFRGDWISADADIKNVNFNGLGNYNVGGVAGILPVKGEVKVNGVSAGAYTLVNNTLTGSFTYNGNTYNISYNESTGKINVTGAATFDLERRDSWYGVELTDDSGNVYSFDGRGNLTGGGTMTVTAANGTSATYNYNGSTITVSGNDYKYGATTLYIHNQFTGTWYISGSYGEQLVIGKFNATGTATGTYYGKTFTFTYHRNGNYVTMTDPADSEALPLYINVLNGGDVVELAVAYTNDTEGMFSVCIKNNSDGHEGDYSYDGGTLTLDGFGGSVFTDGAAKYVKDGETLETYTYGIDEFNQVLLCSDEDGKFYIFYETAGGVYEKDGKHYAKVLPDNLYTVKATLNNGDGSVLISFYGNGIAKDSDGGVYTYEITDHDTSLLEYTLTMTKGGETKTYVLDYNSYYDEEKGEYYTITVPDALYKLKASDGKTVITFSGNGTAKRSDGVVYKYEIKGYAAELKQYVVILTGDDKEETYVLDCSKDYDPENEVYYTLTVFVQD